MCGDRGSIGVGITGFMGVVSRVRGTPTFYLNAVPVLDRFVYFLRVHLVGAFRFRFVAPISRGGSYFMDAGWALLRFPAQRCVVGAI